MPVRYVARCVEGTKVERGSGCPDASDRRTRIWRKRAVSGSAGNTAGSLAGEVNRSYELPWLLRIPSVVFERRYKADYGRLAVKESTRLAQRPAGGNQ